MTSDYEDFVRKASSAALTPEVRQVYATLALAESIGEAAMTLQRAMFEVSRKK